MEFHKNNICGEVSIINGKILYGWAVDKVNIERSLVLDLYYENYFLSHLFCNHSIPEVQQLGIKNKNCGFIHILPYPKPKPNERITLKLTNTDLILIEASVSELLSIKDTIIGQVYYDGGLTISGWAIDTKNTSKRVSIEIYSEKRLLAKIKADKIYTQENLYQGHGFIYTLPFDYADGNLYEIRVFAEDIELSGSPIKVRTLSENLSSWLSTKKYLKKEEIDFLTAYLRDLERVVQRHVNFSLYKEWSKAFCNFLVKANPLDYIDKVVVNEKANLEKLLKKSLSSKKSFILLSCNNILVDEALKYFLTSSLDSQASLSYADTPEMFKPQFDPDLFFSYDYLGDTLVIKKDLLIKTINDFGFPNKVEELYLSLVLKAIEEGSIAHHPIPIETKGRTQIRQNKDFRKRFINLWASKKGLNLYLTDSPYTEEVLKVSKELKEEPLVSIIIPTKDKLEYLQKCIESIIRKTTYRNYEIIIVDNDSQEEKTKDYLRNLLKSCKKVKVLEFKEPFNYSKINNFAVKKAKGKVICLLNNDTEVITSNWIEEVLSILLEKKVGIVGCKLIWPNEFVQHAGVVVGVSGLAYHVGNQWLKDEPGYMYRNIVTGRWSAVTAACLFTYKELYLELGGLEENLFPVAFNDTDFCLRAIQKGFEVLFTPYALLHHHESISRGKDEMLSQKMRATREMEEFRERWGWYEDPYYNPNLTLSPFTPPFSGLAMPNRPRRTRIWQKGI